MNQLIKMLIPVTVLAATVVTAAAQNYYVPVNIFPYANDRIQNRNGNLPQGNVVLGGVPFAIQSGVNNCWFAEFSGGPNPRSVTIPVNVRGVKEIHTLLSTAWGQSGQALVRVEVTGTNGAFFAKDMVGNVDIRDWNEFTYTNSINGTTTTQVFTSGTARVDKQVIALPSVFENEEVLSVRVVDSGGVNVSRVYFQGLTVVIDQPPARVWLPELGGNGRQYNAYQAPEGITWSQANAQAQSLGGELVSMNSAAENAFAYSLVGGNAAFWFTNENGDGMGPWIGGLQLPGSLEPVSGWQWVDGEGFSYTNWASGEPNNVNGGTEDRAHFFGSRVPRNSTWNDYPSEFLLRGYVVEFSRCVGDFNGDGGFDGSDVQAFFSDWEAGNLNADVNEDGGIDGQDIEFFFSRWEAGSC